MPITDMTMQPEPFTEAMGKAEDFLRENFPGTALVLVVMAQSPEGGVDVLSYINAPDIQQVGNMLMQFGSDIVNNADLDPRRSH